MVVRIDAPLLQFSFEKEVDNGCFNLGFMMDCNCLVSLICLFVFILKYNKLKKNVRRMVH